MTTEHPAPDAAAFQVERYKYVLQQLHATNENVYRFLAIYQAVAIAISGAALALFVGYEHWGVDAATARAGIVGLLVLLTLVALFVGMLVVIGIVTWLDYRQEECALTDEVIRPGYRRAPEPRNFLRWYETYILAFIVLSLVALWLLGTLLLVPAMR